MEEITQTLREKLAAVDEACKKINASLKPGMKKIGRLSDPEVFERLKVNYVISRCEEFNRTTGGGYPKGKCTLIAGSPNSGKSLRCLEDIYYNQEQDPDFFAVWIESENSITPEHLEGIWHIDKERLMLLQFDPNIGAETILEQLHSIMSAVKVDMVVINSLKCLVPSKLIEENLNSQTPAVAARLNSKMVNKFIGLVTRQDTAFVIITHMYSGIGTYGSPQVISGGAAIRYWASIILFFSSVSIKADDPIETKDGMHISVTVKKNHLKPGKDAYKKFDYFVIYGEGTERILSTVPVMCENGLLSVNRGSYLFNLPDGKEQKIRGKINYRQYMLDNPEVFDFLMKQLGDKAWLMDDMSNEEVEEAEKEENNVAEKARAVLEEE